MKKFLKKIWTVIKLAGKGFMKDRIPKLSASLAYYTIFSLGPMMIVILFLADLFWGRQAVEGRVYEQISDLVGSSTARQIQEIIKNASLDSGNYFTAIVGFVTLLIGATTVFSEIQDSINSIWRLKVKVKKGWAKMLLTRLLSFSLVISLGFLLLVSLVVNTLIESFMNVLQERFPDIAVVLLYILNLALTLLIIWFLFGIIFKVLPDAKIRWKDVGVGALFTALIFMLAKFGISFYIGNSNIGSTYGAAGSLVVLLLWIYFSAIILYFGAEFTKFYAVKFGTEIRPNDYAVMIQTVQVESSKSSIRENEDDQERTEVELQKAKSELDKGQGKASRA